jgi:hypothetical protein
MAGNRSAAGEKARFLVTDIPAVAVDIPSERAEAEPLPDHSFPDLVWAHYRWECSRREPQTPDARKVDVYRRTRVAFEEKYGEIVEAYWCQQEASAVAVTVKQRPRILRMIGFDPTIRLHQVADWETRHAPAIADALHVCETQAVKVAEVLRGASERIAMLWVYSVAQHLLGFVERYRGEPSPETAEAEAKKQYEELVQIEGYYHRAGEKAGRLVYVTGMLFGVFGLMLIALALVGLLALFGAFDTSDEGVRDFFVAYSAGAMGAIVSVLTRMSTSDREGKEKFNVDFEVGRATLRWLGSFRPFLGAVFGVVAYFAVKGGLVQISLDNVSEFEYYTVFAFLAGFSERFTQVITGSAEKILQPADKADKT